MKARDFVRSIASGEIEARALVREALGYFRKIKKEGLAASVDEYFFRLAVDELVINAVRHGNCTVSGGCVDLRITADNLGVKITVRDEGDGFNPDTLPDPRSEGMMFKRGGRGIHILKKIGSVEWDEANGCVVVTL